MCMLIASHCVLLLRRYGHGAEQYTHADRLLVGARRPHVPRNFTLYRDEVLVRAELEWDTIMRWVNFTSSQ